MAIRRNRQDISKMAMFNKIMPSLNQTDENEETPKKRSRSKKSTVSLTDAGTAEKINSAPYEQSRENDGQTVKKAPASKTFEKVKTQDALNPDITNEMDPDKSSENGKADGAYLENPSENKLDESMDAVSRPQVKNVSRPSTRGSLESIPKSQQRNSVELHEVIHAEASSEPAEEVQAETVDTPLEENTVIETEELTEASSEPTEEVPAETVDIPLEENTVIETEELKEAVTIPIEEVPVETVDTLENTVIETEDLTEASPEPTEEVSVETVDTPLEENMVIETVDQTEAVSEQTAEVPTEIAGTVVTENTDEKKETELSPAELIREKIRQKLAAAQKSKETDSKAEESPVEPEKSNDKATVEDTAEEKTEELSPAELLREKIRKKLAESAQQSKEADGKAEEAPKKTESSAGNAPTEDTDEKKTEEPSPAELIREKIRKKFAAAQKSKEAQEEIDKMAETPSVEEPKDVQTEIMPEPNTETAPTAEIVEEKEVSALWENVAETFEAASEETSVESAEEAVDAPTEEIFAELVEEAVDAPIEESFAESVEEAVESPVEEVADVPESTDTFEEIPFEAFTIADETVASEELNIESTPETPTESEVEELIDDSTEEPSVESVEEAVELPVGEAADVPESIDTFEEIPFETFTIADEAVASEELNIESNPEMLPEQAVEEIDETPAEETVTESTEATVEEILPEPVSDIVETAPLDEIAFENIYEAPQVMEEMPVEEIPDIHENALSEDDYTEISDEASGIIPEMAEPDETPNIPEAVLAEENTVESMEVTGENVFEPTDIPIETAVKTHEIAHDIAKQPVKELSKPAMKDLSKPSAKRTKKSTLDIQKPTLDVSKKNGASTEEENLKPKRKKKTVVKSTKLRIPEPPEDTDEYEVINLNKELMENRFSSIFEKFNCCQCNACKYSVMAIALNELPSKYVAVKVKEHEKIINEADDSQIRAAIIQAVLKIMIKPIHSYDSVDALDTH